MEEDLKEGGIQAQKNRNLLCLRDRAQLDE